MACHNPPPSYHPALVYSRLLYSSESFQPVSSRGAYGDQAGGLVREALQLNQKSIEEFCLQVLRGCCPLLLTAGNPLRVLLALREALSLLQACYPHYQWLNRHKLVRGLC